MRETKGLRGEGGGRKKEIGGKEREGREVQAENAFVLSAETLFYGCSVYSGVAIVCVCAHMCVCLFSPLDVYGLTCPLHRDELNLSKFGFGLYVHVLRCIRPVSDTLTVCFKPGCGAYAFFMSILCFMCQTHLFAQMLSEGTNTW